MKTFCMVLISAVVVFVSGCSTSKSKSITITATNTSSDIFHNRVLDILDSLKEDSINIVQISDNSHSIILKCTKKVPNFGYNIIQSGSFPPTSLNYVGPRISIANFDLVFQISNNKCVVKIKNIHYKIQYLSHDLPKAGPSKNIVSEDIKLHKKNTTPQLSKDILNVIREKLLVSSTEMDDSN